jgi:hypothetical protein
MYAKEGIRTNMVREEVNHATKEGRNKSLRKGVAQQFASLPDTNLGFINQNIKPAVQTRPPLEDLRQNSSINRQIRSTKK